MSETAWIILNVLHSIGVFIWFLANLVICAHFALLIKYAKIEEAKIDLSYLYATTIVTGGSAILIASLL